MNFPARLLVALVSIIALLAGCASNPPAPPESAPEPVVDEGAAHFAAGRLDEAKAVYTAAVAEDETDPVAHAYLGRIALQQEDADTAAQHLARAVALKPDDSMYNTWLGSAYLAKMQAVSFMEKGKYVQKSLGHLEKAVELDAGNLEARTILAHYYTKAPAIGGGNPDKARAQIEAIKKLDAELGARLEAELLTD